MNIKNSKGEVVRVNLKNTQFHNRNWTEFIFDGLQLKKVLFYHSRFYHASFKRANLEHADFESSSLWRANLENANLQHAKLCGTNLTNATLDGANLKFANLDRAKLTGASLKGADLSFAKLEQSELECADLEGAVLTGTCLDPKRKPNGHVGKFKRDRKGLCIGWRTQYSAMCGHQLYAKGCEYTAPWFSTSSQECHPGIYLFPTEQAAWNYLYDNPSGKSVIEVRALPRDVHSAGFKWRARHIWVVK